MISELYSDRRSFLAWCAGGLLGYQPRQTAAFAANATTTRTHALALVGAPALRPDFDHLPYVNPEAPKGGRLRLGILGTFENLNRFNVRFLRAPLYLVGAVYEPLMTRSQDEPKTLYGLVAKYVDVDHARQHITFHLDTRARFSDGAAVLAEDVLFTFELLKAKGPPLQRSAYGLVKSADASDAHMIHFDLAGVDDRELPLALASMPVFPKHATDVERFENALLTPPLASGPYVVSEVRPGERLSLRRNPDYWGADLPTRRGLYNFDHISIEYYKDAAALFEAFKSGLIDYREETSASRWATGYDFPAIKEGRVVRDPLTPGRPIGMEGFVFNLRKSKFADVRLREAIAMMFDFEWINANLLSNLYSRTRSYFDASEYSAFGRPAGVAERALIDRFPGAVRADILEGRWTPTTHDGSGRDRDVARRAQSLFEEAGYRITSQGLAKNGTPVQFEIMVRNRDEERLALNFSSSLRTVGIDAQVRLYDEAQYNHRRQNFEYDMIIGQWLPIACPGQEQRARWSTDLANVSGSINITGASSPAIDAMLEALINASDEESYVAAARALDRVLLSGFYFIPLYHTSQIWTAHSTKIEHPRQLPRFPLPPFGMILESWWSSAP